MGEPTLLTGYKVLDFTHALAGPTTTRLMAEMGAEVINEKSTNRGGYRCYEYVQFRSKQWMTACGSLCEPVMKP
jgi:crotonobetainyl-CoA:carnitine CoA-transferase CaiB-like acyl-CoA transferase